MKVFEPGQVREIDEYTIRNEPVSSSGLMERAAAGCAGWISLHVGPRENVIVFAGPGNNGGDGWAIARLLADRGYTHISLYLLKISNKISEDSEINRKRLADQNKVPFSEISKEEDFPDLSSADVIIDALFGTGTSRPLEGISVSLVKHINTSGCRVISVDLPSGLFGKENAGHADKIIKASHTLSFEFPKRSFFYAENEKFTGEWHIIPIGLHPGIIAEKNTPFFYLILRDVAAMFRKRSRFSHKGTFGHALLIAGSYGMTGAAILAARACLRAGVGLLTTHVPRMVYPIIQAAVPEAIFDIDSADHIFTTLPDHNDFDATGVGPGIGTSSETVKGLETLLASSDLPLVIDADALNILATHKNMLGLLPVNSILTPHPGEFDRLAGKSVTGFERNKKQIDFAVQYKVIIVLKGAYSSIAMPDGTCYFNSTGNPGMATAGSGDVLTGIILSLMTQGYLPSEAALMGTFVHGLAGDLAAVKKGQQSLIASDIIDNLGSGFLKIENYETKS